MIRAFHGSPGVPEDFASLGAQLGPTPLQASPRKGYPGFRSTERPSEICLGYSFGCVECLETAASDPNTRGVILISPYLFEEKRIGILKRTLVGIPGLSDSLLKKAGPRAIEEMLEKSSHPLSAPREYIEVSRKYLVPEILRISLLEKSKSEAIVNSALSIVKDRALSVLLLAGTHDQTSSDRKQLAPLRAALPGLQEIRIENAGHALLWTHPETLAREIQRFIGGITK